MTLASQTSLFTNRQPKAVFSDCTEHGSGCPARSCLGRRFRFKLEWPTGIDNDRVALAVLANPSTATESKLDPTVTRWVNYCRDWGYGWAWVVNVRAWRETNPKLVPPDPLATGGDANDQHIIIACLHADLVVCGWGKLGGSRGPVALELIRRAGKTPRALKLNSDGTPAHFLYLGSELKPFAIPTRDPD